MIINFVGTIWGVGRRAMSNLPIRWFYTGMVLYFLTCLQCAVQVTFTFQALIHFTDWVVGHAHLVMFGVFTLWLFGMMTYLFPRLLHRPWYSREVVRVALLAVGRRHGADVRRPDLGRHFSRLLVGIAAALGRIDRRVAAVLDFPRVCRFGDVRGPVVLCLQHLSHLPGADYGAKP